MRKPGIGEANFGALAGTVIGSIGGLFAVGIPQAVMDRDLAVLFSMPRLGLICLLICGPLGWFLGGQLGPRLSNTPRTEGIIGALGGLVPVVIVVLWGWWYITR